MRTAVIVLALLCTGTRAAPATALILAPLAVWLHGTDHGHSVSLVSDRGHVHLVFSHDEGAHAAIDARGAASGCAHDALASSAPASDHVFHLAQDDAATSTPRRDVVSARVATVPAVVLRPVVMATPARRSPPRVQLRSPGPIGTVVLRL